MTQGDASLVASTHRNGSIPFRRNWAVDESRAETAAGRAHQLAGADGPDRRGGARSCPALAGTDGGRRRGRARPGRPAHGRRRPRRPAGRAPAPTCSSSSAPGCPRPTRPTAARWSSGWTRWAPRRWPSAAPRARRRCPARCSPRPTAAGCRCSRCRPSVRLDEIVSEVLGAVVTKQGQALALSVPHGRRVHGGRAHRRRARRGDPAAGRHARRGRRAGPGPRPRGRHQRRPARATSRRSATGCGCSTPRPTTPWPS